MALEGRLDDEARLPLPAFNWAATFYVLYKLDLNSRTHLKERKKMVFEIHWCWDSINTFTWIGEPNDQWKERNMCKKHEQSNTLLKYLSLFCPLRTFPMKSWKTSVLWACQVLLNLTSSTGAEFSSLRSLAVALPMTGTPVLTLRLLGALQAPRPSRRSDLIYTVQ